MLLLLNLLLFNFKAIDVFDGIHAENVVLGEVDLAAIELLEMEIAWGLAHEWQEASCCIRTCGVAWR